MPVVLVHGWGSSFAATWQAPGFTALLEDAGREVIGVDLLGHGTSDKPHDPAAYTDLTPGVVRLLPDGPVDAVGFSLGALTLLELACREPHRFQRLVLAGIGENVFVRERSTTIVDALEGRGDPADVTAQLFVSYASQPGNDVVALTACMKADRAAITPERLAGVTCPVLVVIGERDFAGPGDRLAAALPNARLVSIPRCDHFATPENFTFIDAALEFLDALPA